MTPLEQAIMLWIHLLSAAIWVGGSLFIGIVFSPLLKTMFGSVEERIQIMIKVGKRFNKIAVSSLIMSYVIHVRVIRKDVEDKIMSKQMSQHQIQKLRKKIIILGEITVVLSVEILFFASLLDVGV